jgi:hypothetical protein
MNENDLRDLYARHEPLVAPATDRLLPGVQARHRRHKIKSLIWYGMTGIVVAVLVTGVTLVVLQVALRSNPATHPIGPPAPAGMRMESSLGMQIYAPAAWQVNDTGCGQDDQPSVNRGHGPVAACMTATPPRKEWATISDTGDLTSGLDGGARLHAIDATIDRVPVRRASGPIDGGMYGGWLDAPSRHVHLTVRARTQSTVDAILDSVRLRNVDPYGCGVRPVDLPGAGRGGHFIDPHPESITVCYYGGGAASPLQASTIRTGTAAAQFAAALNSALPGDNPDRPENRCMRSAYPDHIDATIQVRSADGATGRVVATWQVCAGTRLDNGSLHRKFTNDILAAIMDGMKLGFEGA